MKKSHFVLLIVSLLLVVIAIGAVHVIKLVLFTPYVKDNSVVDSEYEGWKKVELDSDCSFCIPEEWKIKRSENRISIVDSSGKIVSVGKKFYIHTEDDLKSKCKCLCGMFLTASQCHQRQKVQAQICLATERQFTFVSWFCRIILWKCT